MDNRAGDPDFLVTRRAKITPAAGRAAPLRQQAAACPVCAVRRSPCWPASRSITTPGSRRGNVSGVSDEVLDAVARALQLDDVERAHLFDLARAANTRPPATPRRAPAPPDRQAQRPTPARRDDGRRRVRAQRAPRHPVRQPARLRALLARVRKARPGRSTSPASSSSTPAPPTSTPTGTGSPTPPSAACGPKPAATPTTARSPTSSASCPLRSEEFRVRWAAHDVTLLPHRHPALPPPARRRPHPRLRRPRTARRSGPDHRRLHPWPGLAVPRRVHPARKLRRTPSGHRDPARSRRTLTGSRASGRSE